MSGPTRRVSQQRVAKALAASAAAALIDPCWDHPAWLDRPPTLAERQAAEVHMTRGLPPSTISTLRAHGQLEALVEYKVLSDELCAAGYLADPLGKDSNGVPVNESDLVRFIIARNQTILDMHSMPDEHGNCAECGKPGPCPTRLAAERMP